MKTSQVMDPTSSSADNGDWGKYIPLHRAIWKSDWDKAHEIISKDKNALTVEISQGDQTALHVAVGIAVPTTKSLFFLKNLLKEINPKSLETLVFSSSKLTVLHRAALVGNTEAVKMLVDINPHLLFCLDGDNNLPIHRAAYNSQKSTFMYLLGACKLHVELSQEDGYDNPFQGLTGAKLLTNVIVAGFLDAACQLLKDYPHLAKTMNGNLSPLQAIARKSDAFHSGERYNFYQRFIYSYVPIKNDDLCDAKTVNDVENQEPYKAKFVGNEKYKHSFFNSVTQRIYDKFWTGALYVPTIKHLHKDKVKHNDAIRIIKFICNEVGKLDKGRDVFKHYGTAFALAVKNDTYEAVEEILEHFQEQFG